LTLPILLFISTMFGTDGRLTAKTPAVDVKALHAKIGELTLENDFLEVAHPRHPFETLGFTSVGCIPCTSRPASGTSVRSGRWSGLAKTECGIHTRTTYGPDRLEPYGEPVRDYRISATGMEPGPWQMGCPLSRSEGEDDGRDLVAWRISSPPCPRAKIDVRSGHRRKSRSR
jgi:hypothetical protein